MAARKYVAELLCYRLDSRLMNSARRKFAPDEYWVMSSQMDLKGFVEAAV
jgi:hypothetical protein